MRIIIVDDELPLLNQLKRQLQTYQNIEVVGTYTSPLDALSELAQTKPDCAFLDIEMSDMSGIDLAEHLSSRCPNLNIMFVTAYNNYAAQAFDVNAIDYLLKPVRPERLAKAVLKLEEMQKKVELVDAPIRIKCLGCFEIYTGNNTIKWPRSKTRELFAYLLQHEGQRLDKYKICDDIWRHKAPTQALAYLQTAVWAIRKSLKDIGRLHAKIEYSNDKYVLYIKDIQWDLQDFNNAYRRYKTNGFIEEGYNAIKCYEGEYLSGEDWLWSDLYRESYARQFSELVKLVST